MSAPRLSICIATLNRATYLGEMLDSLLSQVDADGIRSEVEIVVIDGASTDDTEQVLCDRQVRFPQLRYRRLEAKGGVDLDYCRAVEMARGEYCWLMSDDDLLKPGALAAVLEASRHHYSLIIVNSEIRDASLSTMLYASALPFNTNQTFVPADRERLLTEAATYMSFIGCIVIQRKLWSARNKEAYLGTEFIHLGVIFQSPLPSDTLVLASPYIIIRYGNASWSGRAFETWLFKWPKLIWSFTDLPKAAREKVTAREPWRNLKFLLIYRAQGALTPQVYRRLLMPRLASTRERWSAWLVAHVPGCLVNLLVLTYFAVQKPHLKTLLADFRASPFYYKQCLRRWFKRPANA